MELKKLWEIILQRKWIIIQAFFIIVITAITGSFLITPTYETTAKVKIETADTSSALLSNIGMSGLSSLIATPDLEVGTNLVMVTIAPVLNKVIWRLQLKDEDGNLLRPYDLQKPGFLSSVLSPKPNIKITKIEMTSLFDITAKSNDPKEAAMLANALADVYIEENLKQRRSDYGSVRVFIEEQIKKAKADYLNVLKEIKQFKVSEKTIDLQSETKMAIDKVAELMKEKEDNIIDLTEVRARIETLKSQLGKQSGTMVSGTAISENPQIENLKRILTEMELQLAEELTEKTKDHPDVVALGEKIKKVREELEKETKFFQESSHDLQALERDLSALEVHLIGVNADIDKYMAMLYTIPEKAFAQSQLELKLSASQELYSSLLQNLYQVGVAEAMTLSNIKLVEPAVEPDIDKSTSPNKLLNTMVGCFVGLMIGLGLAFLMEHLDDTLKGAGEVKDLGLTLLGSVPKLKKKDSPLIFKRDPTDPVAEFYRMIRNSMKFASIDKPVNSLLITSSANGEGRSTTVVNLGVTLAREGKRVLIVDTDLRSPGLHTIFGASDAIGLSNILTDDKKPEDVIKKIKGIDGLSLLTSGPVPPDPAAMIESEKMRQMITDLTKEYDNVIMDSSPLFFSNDALSMAKYSDASVLLVESGRISRRAFSRTVEHLKNANISLMGAILNKFLVKRGGGLL